MVTIREAKFHDAAFITQFQLLMALETEKITLDESIVTKGVEAVFEDRAKGTYIVAEKDGNVIASLLLTPEWSDWRNGIMLWIQSVYVLPQHRGRGVYRQMYEFVKTKMESDKRIMGVRLYVDNTNTAAQKVYSSLGMNGEHYTTFEWMKPKE